MKASETTTTTKEWMNFLNLHPNSAAAFWATWQLVSVPFDEMHIRVIVIAIIVTMHTDVSACYYFIACMERRRGFEIAITHIKVLQI